MEITLTTQERDFLIYQLNLILDEEYSQTSKAIAETILVKLNENA